MREHIFPKAMLLALGQQTLRNARCRASSAFPTRADVIVGVLAALMASGLSDRAELVRKTAKVTGRPDAQVGRLLDLLDGRVGSRHMWASKDGRFELLPDLYS